LIRDGNYSGFVEITALTVHYLHRRTGSHVRRRLPEAIVGVRKSTSKISETMVYQLGRTHTTMEFVSRGAAMAPPKMLYQLKITMSDTQPKIWRRILIPTSVTFWELHSTIKVAFIGITHPSVLV
jgi:hypothetical protein